jgi:hypothetical protein
MWTGMSTGSASRNTSTMYSYRHGTTIGCNNDYGSCLGRKNIQRIITRYASCCSCICCVYTHGPWVGCMTSSYSLRIPRLNVRIDPLLNFRNQPFVGSRIKHLVVSYQNVCFWSPTHVGYTAILQFTIRDKCGFQGYIMVAVLIGSTKADWK